MLHCSYIKALGHIKIKKIGAELLYKLCITNSKSYLMDKMH